MNSWVVVLNHVCNLSWFSIAIKPTPLRPAQLRVSPWLWPYFGAMMIFQGGFFHLTQSCCATFHLLVAKTVFNWFHVDV